MLETHTIFDDTSAGSKQSAALCITDIKEAVRDQNRVNVYIDGKYFCSLDISQVVDLHVKIGRILTPDELDELKRASDFGKFYACALEYALMRPRSIKEMRDYLKRKTLDRRVRIRNAKTGEYQTKIKPGYDTSLVPLVMERLEQRGYLDDYYFAKTWVENRNVSKGTSIKKLRLELQQKGIASSIIDKVFAETSRNDRSELQKIIAKKAKKYPDQQKLVQYLLRQGFSYSDISDELSMESSSV
jgi:regulatory protein